jgi:hypothetical protein
MKLVVKEEAQLFAMMPTFKNNLPDSDDSYSDQSDGTEDDEDETEEIQQTVLIESGPWRADEIERFKLGLDMHGWGNWADIASIVKSRTRNQVYGFARKTGKKLYNPGQ